MDYCGLCIGLYESEVELNQLIKYKIYRDSLLYKIYNGVKQFAFKVFSNILLELRYPLFYDNYLYDIEFYNLRSLENANLLRSGFDSLKNSHIEYKEKNIKVVNNITNEHYRIIFSNVMNDLRRVYPNFIYKRVLNELKNNYHKILHKQLMNKLMKELLLESEYEMVCYHQFD